MLRLLIVAPEWSLIPKENSEVISRRTAFVLAESFCQVFCRSYKSGVGSRYTQYRVDSDNLHDFLYQANHAAWFCNNARIATKGSGSRRRDSGTRSLKDFIIKLHTGETLAEATPDWSWEQRERLGQRYLHDLAQDVLNKWHNEWKTQDGWQRPKIEDEIEELLGSLELDGYIYRESRLLSPESDVLDVVEETGLLQFLYAALGLENEETAFHHMALSEEHFLAERWDDSISNSRKFLECVLQEVAAAHSLHCKGAPLPERTYKWPARVRDYLESEGLLEAKERTTIAEVYGLLSQTGGHPYMARNDQVRLLRHLALTFAQFVMLRFQGGWK